jgi:hypothetical protein
VIPFIVTLVVVLLLVVLAIRATRFQAPAAAPVVTQMPDLIGQLPPGHALGLVGQSRLNRWLALHLVDRFLAGDGSRRAIMVRRWRPTGLPDDLLGSTQVDAYGDLRGYRTAVVDDLPKRLTATVTVITDLSALESGIEQLARMMTTDDVLLVDHPIPLWRNRTGWWRSSGRLIVPASDIGDLGTDHRQIVWSGSFQSGGSRDKLRVLEPERHDTHAGYLDVRHRDTVWRWRPSPAMLWWYLSWQELLQERHLLRIVVSHLAPQHRHLSPFFEHLMRSPDPDLQVLAFRALGSMASPAHLLQEVS